MDILYSDKNIAVIIKPVGLDSETETPSAIKQILGGEVFPIHRLDKNVGGVMIYARTKAAAASLSKAGHPLMSVVFPVHSFLFRKTRV